MQDARVRETVTAPIAARSLGAVMHGPFRASAAGREEPPWSVQTILTERVHRYRQATSTPSFVT